MFPNKSKNLRNRGYKHQAFQQRTNSRFIVYIEATLSVTACTRLSQRVSLRIFTLSLTRCLSSREPTHFTVPDLRLATRGITERGNYRGSDYLTIRREIIARDVSSSATSRAKIPLRGRFFLPNCSRYWTIFFNDSNWILSKPGKVFQMKLKQGITGTF